MSEKTLQILEEFLAVTASPEGASAVSELAEALDLITLYLKSPTFAGQLAAKCLINISAEERGVKALIPQPGFIKTLLDQIFNPQSQIADDCCKILSNMTRPEATLGEIVEIIEKTGRNLEAIIDIFTKTNYNKHGKRLDYLGPILSNLSRNDKIRQVILDENKGIIQKLLPFTQFKQSLERRGGVVGTLRNCCMDSLHHQRLLSEPVDILPSLLLPLAGGESFDDEDNDKLPIDLQFLPSDKKRESDPDIRCMLLEAITQLCNSRPNREVIRDKNTYVILRELHKWETDEKALIACENLVDILIRTEAEIGLENLKDVQVPEDVQVKLNKLDI